MGFVRALFLLAMVCVAAHAKDYPKEEGAKAEGPAAASGGGGGGSTHDVVKLGGKGDGKTDSTKAVNEAWTAACAGTGKQTIVVPKGDFLTGPLNFTGPCKGDIVIQLDGNLLSSTDLALFKSNWIEIMRLESLEISGKGKLDGQGAAVWSKNSCAKKYDCKILPNVCMHAFL